MMIDPSTVDKAAQTIQTMNWEGLIFLAVIIITGFGLIWLWLKKESKKEPEPIKIEFPIDEETINDIQRKINQCRTALDDLKSEMLIVKSTESRIESDMVRVSNHLRDLVDKMSYFTNK